MTNIIVSNSDKTETFIVNADDYDSLREIVEVLLGIKVHGFFESNKNVKIYDNVGFVRLINECAKNRDDLRLVVLENDTNLWTVHKHETSTVMGKENNKNAGIHHNIGFEGLINESDDIRDNSLFSRFKDDVNVATIYKPETSMLKENQNEATIKVEDVDESDDSLSEESYFVMNTQWFEEEKKKRAVKLEKMNKENQALNNQLNAHCHISQNTKLYDLQENIERLEQRNERLLHETYETTNLDDLNQLFERRRQLELRNANDYNIYNRLKDAEKVDLCFLVDCTGSMDIYIDEVRRTIKTIKQNLQKRFDKFELRCAFVGYRDHSDLEDRVTVLQFTNDIDNFESFVKGIKCFGGDDQCEDVFGGLEEVGKLNWKNTSSVLIHIADAPCHGAKFHFNALDYFSNGDPRGLEIKKLLKRLVEHNISYFFIEINDSTHKMISEFNKELKLMHANRIEIIKLVSVNEFSGIVERSIEVTVKNYKTTSSTKKNEKKIRTYELEELPVDWSKIDFVQYKGMYIVANLKGKLDNMKESRIEYNYIESDIWKAQKPFAKGALRYAFAGMLSEGKINDEHVLLNCVIKESIFTAPNYNSIEYHKDLVEIQVISRFLAYEFSKVYKSDKKFYIIDVNILLIHDLGQYYTIEKFVDGEFLKWSDNNGGIDKKIYEDLLDAFSHWTYDATNEYLLVVDLQGFKFKNKEFILTDPVILCQSEPNRYTNTNLGAEGIKNFFAKHQCNSICRHLDLSKQKKYQK